MLVLCWAAVQQPHAPPPQLCVADAVREVGNRALQIQVQPSSEDTRCQGKVSMCQVSSRWR